MIRIGLFSTPINDNLPSYLGLFRMSDLFDFKHKYNKEIDWFYKELKDYSSIEYNEKNRNNLIELYDKLQAERWQGNLIIFTDQEPPLNITNFIMRGFDICADSMYYSPLGDGLLIEYHQNENFYSEMNMENYSHFRKSINDKWLFTSYDVAFNFAHYCNIINKIHIHCIESEDHWRPYAIYEYIKSDYSLYNNHIAKV